ncbi:hypothetical protein DIPPA_27702 [Diplonema papillatum]|nr:hypothetical protein DIPPA_27702 [Diplonema papillatum]
MQAFRRVARFASTAAAARHAPDGGVLLVLNGRVASFARQPRSLWGYTTGDRVRCFAGSRIGQVGIVVGERNSALWVLYTDDTVPEAYASQHIARMDFRLVDTVSLKGLDPSKYGDGDAYDVDGYGAMQHARRESQVDVILDDASTQHLVDEYSPGRPCERCERRSDEEYVLSCVENLGQTLGVTERLNRLLTLRTATHPPLNSPKAIAEAVSEALAPSFDKPHKQWFATPADALADLLVERSDAFDTLCEVRVAANSYPLPKAILSTDDAVDAQLAGDQEWIKAMPCFKSLAGAAGLRRVSIERDVTLQLGCAPRDVAQYLRTAVVSGNEPETPSSSLLEGMQGLSGEGKQWVTSALLHERRGKPALATRGDLKQILLKAADSDSDNVSGEEDALTDELSLRLGILSKQVDVSIDGGQIVGVPSAALQSNTARVEVTILDEPWCAAIVNTHHALSSSKGDAARAYAGKVGTVTKTTKAAPLEFASLAKQLLHQLSVYRGRHRKPQLPEADVFCPDAADFKYLDRACAIELYANAVQRPTMLYAGGMDIYKKNGWHQPFNMVNDHGLEKVAQQYIPAKGYARKSVFYARSTPSPLG